MYLIAVTSLRINNDYFNANDQADGTGSVQTYTVTTSGIYSVDVKGAGGGASANGSLGGNGADQVVTVYLEAGQILSLVVGALRSNGNSGGNSGGGGGGSLGSSSSAILIL